MYEHKELMGRWRNGTEGAEGGKRQPGTEIGFFGSPEAV